MHKFFHYENYVQFYNDDEKKITTKLKFFTSIVNIEKIIRIFVIMINRIKIIVIYRFEKFFNDYISNKKNVLYAKNLNINQ